jgi:hypothetical protein
MTYEQFVFWLMGYLDSYPNVDDPNFIINSIKENLIRLMENGMGIRK